MKAILVIDKPENCRLIDTQNKCRGCAFYYENKDDKMSCYIDDYIKDCKGTCPLKPMPQKKEVEVNKIEDIMYVEYSIEDIYKNKYVADIQLATDKLISLGWNACIESILGEEE